MLLSLKGLLDVISKRCKIFANQLLAFALQDADVIQMVRHFLLMTLLILKIRQQRVVRQPVCARFKPKQELVCVALVQGFLGRAQLLLVEDPILVFVELFGEEVVAI